MLSGAITSVQDMAMNTAKEFQEPFGVGGTESVWFDSSVPLLGPPHLPHSSANTLF